MYVYMYVCVCCSPPVIILLFAGNETNRRATSTLFSRRDKVAIADHVDARRIVEATPRREMIDDVRLRETLAVLVIVD